MGWIISAYAAALGVASVQDADAARDEVAVPAVTRAAAVVDAGAALRPAEAERGGRRLAADASLRRALEAVRAARAAAWAHGRPVLPDAASRPDVRRPSRAPCVLPPAARALAEVLRSACPDARRRCPRR
jgi:hypothetical protein